MHARDPSCTPTPTCREQDPAFLNRPSEPPTLARNPDALPPHQIVSQAPAVGTVRCIASLADVQGEEFKDPCILIAEQVRH